MTATRTRRLAAAVAAALAATAAAGLPAAPAFAQDPSPTNVLLDLDDPQVPGNPPRAASLDVDFAEDPTGVLAMRLEVDTADATIYFGAGPGCETPDNVPFIECETADPGTANRFTFTIAAATGTALGEYDYTLTVLLGGNEIHTETGTVEVVEDRYDGVFRDYTAEDLAFSDIAAGTVVDVQPRFTQNSALPDDTYAVIAAFGAGLANMGAEGVGHDAPWDNCSPNIWEPAFATQFCFFLDYEDAAGTTFQLAEPIPYTVDADAPGPLAVCGCGYDLFAVNREVFERDFGEPWWDADSPDLMTLETAADQNPLEGDSDGTLVIATADSPYDLTVEGADLTGGEVELTIPIGNDGPARALTRPAFEAEPSYFLRGQLPAGAEVVSVEAADTEGSPGWRCFDDTELDDRREALEVGTELDRIDFACAFWGLGPGESTDVTITVDVSDATGTPGRVEVDAFFRGVDGVNLDGDPSNNAAALTVDGRSLPNTGSSTIVFAAVAAGALLLGIVLFLVARRRRPPPDPAA
ncbi:LPXTG cell wall anchor domain-containing protein [Glycomyces sp. NPDC047010]|uniref:LPXTG cell wall anchor domain-containing protein n=1 Tax=Glycomyces sp. NPDC047010 TaxID=3155023 RepID=UPI0033F934F7